MNKINPIVAVSVVVVLLGLLAFVIYRNMGSSDSDMKGLIPPPRPGSPTFQPEPVTPRTMPTTDTPQARPTGKLKNITPPGDTQ